MRLMNKGGKEMRLKLQAAIAASVLLAAIADGGTATEGSGPRQFGATSVVSHAKSYNMIRTCYAVWHVGKQHGTGDNG